MTAGTQTLRLEETLLEPPALPPPPTRHALFAILIALAALLYVATIGTGDLYSQTEGQYAGAAREMVETHRWLLPTNDGIPRLQTAVALLAHYCFVQALWRKRGSSAPPRCARGRRFSCLDFFDWGKAHGLLARFLCRSHLSQLLRYIFARAHSHA